MQLSAVRPRRFAIISPAYLIFVPRRKELCPKTFTRIDFQVEPLILRSGLNNQFPSFLVARRYKYFCVGLCVEEPEETALESERDAESFGRGAVAGDD